MISYPGIGIPFSVASGYKARRWTLIVLHDPGTLEVDMFERQAITQKAAALAMLEIGRAHV